MYDIIGDVHGYADRLETLLQNMGYELRGGCYRHSERIAFFVGDIIDKGPQVREALNIVRSMCESGAALMVLGNHEYNALCYHTKNTEGHYLRNHSTKNSTQHEATLSAFASSQHEWKSHLKWLATLPLFFENEHIRIVHAAWIQRHIDFLRVALPAHELTSDFLQRAVNSQLYEYEAVEQILKGVEVALPQGYCIIDKYGYKRHVVRGRWWRNGEATCKYTDFVLGEHNRIPDINVPQSFLSTLELYSSGNIPVFFGHYWLSGTPTILTTNICCTDFSVAKGGFLAAYRWQGESKLTNNHWTYV